MSNLNSTIIPRMGGSSKLRAVVAMSGGVDSSVAAALLAREGFEVIGVTMRLFPSPFEGAGRLGKSCCSLEDVEDARAVCRKIGARHFYLNFEKDFKEHVIDYFISEYENGRTPHPCIACNDRMKFEFLMRRAEVMEADVLATGHYARLKHNSNGLFQLLRGKDRAKDQSYVLYNLGQEQMKQLRFPIGDFTKENIRKFAQAEGLANADKPDSQDICFVPLGDYRTFVDKRISKPRQGRIVDTQGKTLGQHDGIHNFTVGQRKGLSINGNNSTPRYVLAISSDTGDVVVGHAKELLVKSVFIRNTNWTEKAPEASFRASVRIRYNGKEEDAKVLPIGSDAKIIFDNPVRAATPGQAAVFYDGERLVGGGIISHASNRVGNETDLIHLDRQ